MDKPKRDTQENWKQTACNLCFVNCGIEVQTGGEDHRQIIKVRGDKAHPKSKGYICNKAARLNYYQNNRARIDQPLRRTADGNYEQIDWDTAITEIAQKLSAVRDSYGGERIFYYGGGAQGNHLGGSYANSVQAALGIKYKGNALSQEKTGLAWVLSRMIGAIPHAEISHAQTVMFVGKNPFVSNGMSRARNFLREIRKDESRKLIVVDPRRTETADYADFHLAVKPGHDAWCMAAIIARLVQADALPHQWLAQHTTGYERVIEKFSRIPVDDYATHAGLEPQQIYDVASTIAASETFALEEDIGVQMAPHSTLVSYLNILLQLLTGNFGKPDSMGIPAQLVNILPLDQIGELDENDKEMSRPRLPVTGAPIHSNIYPGNYLAEEILNDSEQRPRALIVESANPVHSLAGSDQLGQAIRSLECSVAIDVALTETARQCDYVLPAQSQYEKWEATFFPREYPDNYFHLRPPVFEHQGNALGEPEIHARLLEALDYFEEGELDTLHDAATKGIDAYQQAFIMEVMTKPKIKKAIGYVLYRTLGPILGTGRENTASIWGLCQVFAMTNPKEMARAGFEGPRAGTDLFEALLNAPSGLTLAVCDPADTFEKVPFPDHKLRLVIGELFEELDELQAQQALVSTSDEFPFAMVAGARGAYTANCAIRDPAWAKGNAPTAVSIHPDDAAARNLPEGARVIIDTAGGSSQANLVYDERLHTGTLMVPNGQGMLFEDEDGAPVDSGVYVNKLTQATHRDKFIGTPLHKFVPARVSLA